MNITLMFALAICVICTLLIFVHKYQIKEAEKTIQEYEALIYVQDEIITQYRKKFGDIKINLSKGDDK